MRKNVIVLAIALTLIACVFMLAGCGGLLDGLASITGEDAETAQMKSEAEVKAVLGSNYKMTINYGSKSSSGDSNESWTDVSYVTVAGNYTGVVYVDKSDDQIETEHYLYGNNLMYGYDKDAEKYTTASAYTSSAANPAYGYVMGYVGKEIEYNTVSDVTYIKRPCKKYVRTVGVTSAIVGVSAEYSSTYIVDNSSGLCLKFEISGSTSTATEGSSSGSMSYAVTELTIGGVSLDSEIAKIAVKEWPDAATFLTFGLTAIAKPTGTYTGGSVELTALGAIDDFKNTFSLDDADAAEALCNAFFSAGANCDSDGSAAFADLFSNEYGTSFTAYTASGSCVRVSGYSDGEGYVTSIEISKN